MTFGETVRQLRQMRGWKQAELARRSGIHQAMISNLERDRYASPTGETLERLAAAFGVSVDMLLHGDTGSADQPPLWLRQFERYGHLLTPKQRQMILDLARSLAEEAQAREGAILEPEE
jgi:transcriptional regulator with XRE-family HTH domain